MLQLDTIGDFSVYTLYATGPDLDPFFASRRFRFRLACDDPFDCRPEPQAEPPTPELPVVIDYLAKDYSGFRQALLDFIPTRFPGWTERSEADVGMMILELLAATADSLSYMQDRVANEAFLSTATQRRSVASHLALIGYQLDPGAAAHTWLYFRVRPGVRITAPSGLQVSNKPARAEEPLIIFETATVARLSDQHNDIRLFDWGNPDCCLPRGSTTAVLIGSFKQFEKGDYLLIEDTRGNREIVRLIQPAAVSMGTGGSPPTGSPPDESAQIALTTIRWSPAASLRADYCIAETTVRGNIALATHGETVEREPLHTLDSEQQAALAAEIAELPATQSRPRQRLRLSQGPVAYIDTATRSLMLPVGEVREHEALTNQTGPTSTVSIEVDGFDDPWENRATLLDSGPDATVFRVELDDDGDGTIVFGDGKFGLAPPETANVTATYRVGGGIVGNVAAGTLIAPRTSAPWLELVTNPLPATGGRNLESKANAKRFAPATFQKSGIAVTVTDYQNAAQSFRDASGQNVIQRANASFRWTGSWLTVTLALDPLGQVQLDPELLRGLRTFLDSKRLAGYDVRLIRAVYLPIELTIEFCVKRGFFSGQVQKDLQEAFSARDLARGRRGFFHPDNFSFGENVYVSRIYAMAVSVPGVESAAITRLARLRSRRPEPETAANLSRGHLLVGADQIVRLDNDRNFPENGILSLVAKGSPR